MSVNVLEPYEVAFMGDKSGGELVFRKFNGVFNEVALKVMLPFDQDILDAHKCENTQGYYSLEVAPIIQQELGFDNSQMAFLESFLVEKKVLGSL